MNFKPAVGSLTQDTEYFRGPVYRAQEINESSYGSVHPASSMLGQDSNKLKAEPSQSQPHLRTANYSSNRQGNVHNATETFHAKEATRDEASNRNDPNKQAHLLKLPQDSYNGPDSYHTTTPAPSKSPPLSPLGIYQLETPKEIHQAPNIRYQPQKPKESVTRQRDQYQIPASTEVYNPIMLNLQPPNPNEPYKSHLDGNQFQSHKQIYEPQTGAYQYADMKESMKQPQYTQKPPKPKEYLTPPSDTYQLTESENSFTTTAKILQPPKSKHSFKQPTITYHDIKPEDSLTPPVDMHKHTEVDLLKQYMDVHKPPKPQDILTPPVHMYEHPKLKDSYKPQRDRPQPQEQKYVFQGAMESYQHLPARQIHKPLVLSPEEFYNPLTKLQIPSKDDNQMPSSSDSLKGLFQPSLLTHANNHSEDIDEDMYFDYDPSTYVQKENSNGHTHKPLNPKESLTPNSDIYQLTESEDSSTKPAKLQIPSKDDNKMPSSSQFLKDLSQTSPLTQANKESEDIDDDVYLDYDPSTYVQKESSNGYTHKIPKPKESATPPSDTYQLTESKDSFTTPAKILQPPKSKNSFKPPNITYHSINPEGSLTPPVDMHNATEVEDLLKEYMDVHKPLKPQDILTPPADMYKHLQFYKPPIKLQIPTKDDNKMPLSSESLKGLSQPFPLTHTNNQTEDIDDDIYLDYDPSTYVQKETSSGHAPPQPPNEQPPKDKLEGPPSTEKETNGSLSPPPSKPHEAPPTSSKEPYGATPPLHLGPYGGPMYLPEQTYAAPIHPPNYVYGIHNFGYPYGVPPPPTTTIPPPSPPPKRRRVGYYYIGRKLYLVPAVFSFLFIPYILAHIIKSVIRRKVKAPFNYWKTARKIDLDENEMERRVARALEAVEKRYN